MKKLLKLLMILFLALTLSSCETLHEAEPIEVPDYSVAVPERPELAEIPNDTSGAIKALTNNMRALVFHIEKLEVYITNQEIYYKSVIDIINR
jgi:ABC-type uncharacterized transport system auxiliary subunit